MKKRNKDFQKNYNKSRDAPKDSNTNENVKSKLVHSEDYRNKILKTGERFKDKIAEKDNKLIQDNATNVASEDTTRKSKRQKIPEKETINNDKSSYGTPSKLVHSEDYRNKIIKTGKKLNENKSSKNTKSKLVHSEDYRNKIIKSGERFKDKIAEKYTKLVQDNTTNVENQEVKRKPKRAKLLDKNTLSNKITDSKQSKLVHSENYRNKIIKSKEKCKDKLRRKSSKLIQDENKHNLSNNQYNYSEDANKEPVGVNSEQTSNSETENKQNYKRKNYKNTIYTRTRNKKLKKDNNKSENIKDSSKGNLSGNDKVNLSDKKLKKYQRKQYKLYNKKSNYKLYDDIKDNTLKFGAKTSELTRDYLSQGSDNSGIESAEKVAGASSKLQHGIRKYKLDKKKKTLRKISKLENKISKRSSKLEFRSAIADLKNKKEYQKANAVKKFFKRKQMKKMIAKKHEARFVDRVKKSFLSLNKKVKEIIVKKVKGFLFIAIAIFMLFMVLFGIGSIGGSGLNNSSNSVLTTSYLSDKDVLNGINTNFTNLENELADKISNIPTDYPGYDQYVYIDTENIGHSIYELFAYITSKCGGPNDPSEVQPDLIELFNKMYQLEFKEKVEIKTRTVRKEYIDGRGRVHIIEEKEPYEYKTLITTLKYKTIGDVAKEVFQNSEDNMLHYNTLMETKGNSGLTFGNSELIEANGGVGGGQDYEASSDIQKKIVDACYITPSPGKGWCAMWVSQVYQNAGLGYIGGNACDLYRRYAFTSDSSKLQVGMLVMVESSSSGTQAGLTYGHVGIYIGDGKVMDNIGKVRITTLDDWIKTYCKNSPVGFGYPPSVQP